VCIIENLLIIFNLVLLQLITFKQKPNFSPLLKQHLIQQSNSLHVSDVSILKQTKSPLNAIKNSASKSQNNITTIDLSNVDVLNPTVSESEASSKNKSNVSDVIIDSIVTPQKSTLDVDASNSNDSKKTDNTDKTPVMTDDECPFKITNVTSLPPEVFENVPDVCNDVTLHNTTDDTSSLSASKMLMELATHISAIKRSMHEGNLIQ